MLTLANEPANGHAIALCRIHDDGTLAPIPPGALVRIVGVIVHEVNGDAVAWTVAHGGNCYIAFPDELRPAHRSEMIFELNRSLRSVNV